MIDSTVYRPERTCISPRLNTYGLINLSGLIQRWLCVSQVTATGVIQGSETGALPTSVQFKMSSPGDVQPSVRDCSSGLRIRV